MTDLADTAVETDVSLTDVADPGPTDPPHPDDDLDQALPDTFPRVYVERLRQENAKYRQRAERSDDLAKRLHVALVAATGRLADPTDLEFDQQHLDDPDALVAAIDALVAVKPHLASRRPLGNVGQGLSEQPASVSLASILRAGAN